ncbi:MAG TPA: hypothetical protein VKI61_14315 [Chitinophagaceae bacterium]|jgi:hypothetical protein|nr:hypothetical protein [Chitinophagaceae bacterium]
MKKKVTNSEKLAEAIAELEMKSAAQKKDIQETFKVVSENLKPLNLVKSGIRSVFSGEHKEDLVNVLIGLGSGFLSRKLIVGRSNGFVGKTVGKAIQWGMAGLVSKNAEKIKEKAGELIDRLFRKHKPQSNHTSEAQSLQHKT